MPELELESVTQERVSIENVLLGRWRQSRFDIGGKEHEFELCQDHDEYEPQFRMKLKISDHYVWLTLDHLPDLGHFSSKFEDVGFEKLPSELKPVALEHVFGEVVRSLEQQLGIVIEVDSYEEGSIELSANERLSFRLMLNGRESPVNGQLLMEFSALEFLAAILERTEELEGTNCDEIEVPVHFVIARETLRLSDFRSLNPLDIVMLSDMGFLKRGDCHIVVGNAISMLGKYDGNVVTLLDTMENQESDLDKRTDAEQEAESVEVEIEEVAEAQESEPEPQVSGEEINVDDLPVNLVFEVGHKRIPLSELKTIKQGYTFELDNKVETPITIRANGRKIGDGEIIKVGDRIGVRVKNFK